VELVPLICQIDINKRKDWNGNEEKN